MIYFRNKENVFFLTTTTIIGQIRSDGFIALDEYAREFLGDRSTDKSPASPEFLYMLTLAEWNFSISTLN